MSLTDPQFKYVSRNDSTLSASYRTAAVSDRPTGRTSGSRDKTASPTKRSSSVAASRRRHIQSRDVGMATLRWSKRQYSVKELAQEFNGQFPLLVRVTQDFRCSEVNDFKLDVGQVYYSGSPICNKMK